MSNTWKELNFNVNRLNIIKSVKEVCIETEYILLDFVSAVTIWNINGWKMLVLTPLKENGFSSFIAFF